MTVAERPPAGAGRGEGADRVVVRAPNHLGDLLMALPALEAAGAADVVVRRWLVPLLELAPIQGRILPLDGGRAGFVRAVRALRERRYRRGVLLTPSFSAALLFALGGVSDRRGTATDGRSFLLSDAVAPDSLAGMHRAAAYLHLVTGRPGGDPPPPPRLAIPAALRDAWEELVGPARGVRVGIFPGSNASSRRWDPERFAELAARLVREGAQVVVFGGPGERELTARVAGGVAFDAGGRTDLPLLAAGLASCDLLVTNDSGPMHLAAVVGTPTVSLWGAGDPASTGPLGAGHVLLRHAELPCVPCVKNECRRRGAGTFLPEAERECLRLVSVDQVAARVLDRLAELRSIA